jgi:hypothetical protein
LIATTASVLDEEVLVIDVQTGAVTYREPIDIGSGNPNGGQDWPMVEWGTDFPVEMGGLEACTAPP